MEVGHTPIQINVITTQIQLMVDASDPNCKLNESRIGLGDEISEMLTTKPIMSPWVKHEIEGLRLCLETVGIEYTAAHYRERPSMHAVMSSVITTAVNGLESD